MWREYLCYLEIVQLLIIFLFPGISSASTPPQSMTPTITTEMPLPVEQTTQVHKAR